MSGSTSININICKGNTFGNGAFIANFNDTGQTYCAYKHYWGWMYGMVVEPNDDVVVLACGPELNGTNPMNPNKRFQLCKLDSNGNQIWWKQYGFDSATTTSSNFFHSVGIIKNPIDDGYICWGGDEY